MRIDEYINDVLTPTDALEHIGGWLEGIKNAMDCMDRAYFVQAPPEPVVWPEIGGSFHSLQMSVLWILLAIDELLKRFPAE